MINNFDKFDFKRVDGEFYFFQIIKRKKDNPDVSGINGNNSARCIKEYSIYNEEELNKKKDQMIDLAIVTNSRIYMHPARRNKEKVGRLMNYMMGEHILLGKHTLCGIYRSACGKVGSYNEKLRVVDIDNDKEDGINFNEKVDEITKHVYKSIQQTIVTSNGIHLITIPFDSKKFMEKFPTMNLHKNNPTLMYFN